MNAATERFVTAVAPRGLHPEIRFFDETTHTAAQAAAAIGCDVAAIVKSLVFVADDQPLLVLVSGPRRVDTDALGARLGATIGKADAAMVKSATGFSIGGVPPFGHPKPLRTVVDEGLLELDELWAAAGSANSVFPITPTRLVELSAAQVLRVD
ncbi:YbaK/EbsC family protein [uncultured Schumannella sp.]|uniref:YbaK/EbsC family protein n=1 Tax=uncultured Schumannella sp. TaxID=1195956 RepID=UPI0025DC352C|nr:YbaK/EbsC family protein [uncultured Schumannella sp.]